MQPRPTTALGQRYAEEVTLAHRQALDDVDLVGETLPTVLDRVLDPIVAFKNSHAAFVTLFGRPDLPPSLVGPAVHVDEEFAVRIAEILHRRNPERSPSDVRDAADTMITLFRGVVGTLGRATGDPDRDLAEVKLALLGYLDRKQLQ